MTIRQSLQTILAVAIFSPPLTGYLMIHDLFIVSGTAPLPPLARLGAALGHPAFLYGIAAYLSIAAIAVLGLRRNS